jgi:glutamine synthetase
MMNPYLAFAMVIEAGLCGVQREEKLLEPLEAAAAHELENGKRYDKLPLSLAEAVECARTSSFLQEDEDRSRIATHFLDLIEKDML